MGHREDGVICGCFGPCPECEPERYKHWVHGAEVAAESLKTLTHIEMPKIKAVYPSIASLYQVGESAHAVPDSIKCSAKMKTRLEKWYPELKED